MRPRYSSVERKLYNAVDHNDRLVNKGVAIGYDD